METKAAETFWKQKMKQTPSVKLTEKRLKGDYCQLFSQREILT